MIATPLALIVLTKLSDYRLKRVEQMYKVETPFLDSGYRLYVGPDLDFYVDPERDSAYLVDPFGLERRYTGYSMLAGHVTFHTPEEAVLYVRLRTNPITSDSFHTIYARAKEMWLEIIPTEDVDEHFTYGANYFRMIGAMDGWYAGVKRDRLAKLGYQKPVAVPIPGGYVVKRWIYNFQSGIGRSTEIVLSDGTYIPTFQRSAHQPDINFTIPARE